MRWIALLVLLAACSSSAPAPQPKTTKVPATEPNVRVHLRSYGDWTQLRIKGKGGLTAEAGEARHDAAELTLVQVDGASIVQGIEGKHARVCDSREGGRLHARLAHLLRHARARTRARWSTSLPLENYVLGVLRGEIPLKDVPEEAGARAGDRGAFLHDALPGAGEAGLRTWTTPPSSRSTPV